MQSRLDTETFDSALEKLWIHGGAQIDYAENVSRGSKTWPASYEVQREQKLAQLEQMLRFAECNQCRMVSLVRHFGDFSDARTRCGICDFCAPDACLTQTFRPADDFEMSTAWKALGALRTANRMTSGKLHAEAASETALDRRTFERMLGGLARAGLVELQDASFEKDGRRIDFKRVNLTAQGRAVEDRAALAFSVTEPVEGEPKARTRSKRGKQRPVREPKRAKRDVPLVPVPARAAGPPERQPRAESDDRVQQALRAWRLAEAKRQAVPAFRILADKTLEAIASEKPETAGELLSIPGIGLRTVEKYGAAIFRILHEKR
jgi:DNA topoisomerase-3